MEPLRLLSFILVILGGHIALPAVLLTLACSRTVARRSATLINFLACVIAYATAILLLFYAGEATSDEPSFVLCRLQSALVHASGPLLTFAGMALVLETYGHVSCLHQPERASAPKRFFLVGIPWLIFFIFFLAFFLVGLNISPDMESWSSRQPLFYCRFPDIALRTLGYSLQVFGSAIIIMTEVFIAMKVGYRIGESKSKGLVLPVSFLHLLLRGLLFTVYTFVTLCVVFFVDNFRGTESAYVVFALLPLMTFLLFGTQRDLLRVWFCRAPIFDPPVVETEFSVDADEEKNRDSFTFV